MRPCHPESFRSSCDRSAASAPAAPNMEKAPPWGADIGSLRVGSGARRPGPRGGVGPCIDPGNVVLGHSDHVLRARRIAQQDQSCGFWGSGGVMPCSSRFAYRCVRARPSWRAASDRLPPARSSAARIASRSNAASASLSVIEREIERRSERAARWHADRVRQCERVDHLAARHHGAARQAPGAATMAAAVAPHALGLLSATGAASVSRPPRTRTRSIVASVRTVSLRNASLGIDFRITVG